jgi:hypothetical protein
MADKIRRKATPKSIAARLFAARADQNTPPSPPPQVGTAALFSAEVYAWFCVGEIVGRGGGLTGY